MFGGVLFHFLDLGRVTAGRLAHACVNGVPRPCQSSGGQGPEPARCTGNDNDVFHYFLFSFMESSFLRIKTSASGFPFWNFPFERKQSGEATVGAQHLPIDPTALGACKE